MGRIWSDCNLVDGMKSRMSVKYEIKSRMSVKYGMKSRMSSMDGMSDSRAGLSQ